MIPVPASGSRLRVLVATTNQHKLDEIRQLLRDVPITLLSLSDFPAVAEPEETGRTFEENARLKALAYAPPGVLTVAEDSGLEVDALGGEPGVHSARFLGPDATYPERFAELARRLRGTPRPWTARFVCALAVVMDGLTLFETRAIIEGEIADAPSGATGFGYDPIFHFPPYARTLADVSQPEKLAVAHRGKAFRQLGAWLEASLGTASAEQNS